MIAIYLSKQRALDATSKTIQQINFTENLEQHTAIFIIVEVAKETFLDFSQETIKGF